MQLYIVLALMISLLAALFAFQNPAPVSIHLFKAHFDGSLAVVCLLIFALGFLSNMMLGFGSVIKRKLKIRSLEKRVKDLEDKLADKETHPIYDVDPQAPKTGGI